MARTSLKSILLAGSASALAVGGALGLNGVAALGWHAAVRVTAVMAFVLWWLSFSAGPLARIAPLAPTAHLLARRREIGLAFATVLAAHGLTILQLSRLEPSTLLPGFEVAIGGLGFAFTFAMAGTSTDAAVRRLGHRRWRILHRTGQGLLAVIFLSTYGGRFAQDPSAWIGLASLLCALALRPAAMLQARLRSRTLPTE